jgi:putative transposase
VKAGTAPTEQPIRPKALGRLIGAFKTVSTKRINLVNKSEGVKFWQRDFFDHIIRHDADLHRIRTYIANNPLQWSEDEENPDNIA